MATILLTDDEYNYIKTQLDALTNKIETASPRAATHFAAVAKLHAEFLLKEDSKRVLQQGKAAMRTTFDQKREARRTAAQQRQKAPSSNAGRTQKTA